MSRVGFEVSFFWDVLVGSPDSKIALWDITDETSRFPGKQ